MCLFLLLLSIFYIFFPKGRKVIYSYLFCLCSLNATVGCMLAEYSIQCRGWVGRSQGEELDGEESRSLTDNQPEQQQQQAEQWKSNIEMTSCALWETDLPHHQRHSSIHTRQLSSTQTFSFFYKSFVPFSTQNHTQLFLVGPANATPTTTTVDVHCNELLLLLLLLPFNIFSSPPPSFCSSCSSQRAAVRWAAVCLHLKGAGCLAKGEGPPRCPAFNWSVFNVALSVQPSVSLTFLFSLNLQAERLRPNCPVLWIGVLLLFLIHRIRIWHGYFLKRTFGKKNKWINKICLKNICIFLYQHEPQQNHFSHFFPILCIFLKNSN